MGTPANVNSSIKALITKKIIIIYDKRIGSLAPLFLNCGLNKFI